jgi:hypothetical protein
MPSLHQSAAALRSSIVGSTCRTVFKLAQMFLLASFVLYLAKSRTEISDGLAM